MKTLIRVILLITVFHVLNGCYKLNAISLNPNVETVSIANFPNFSPLQNPTLSQSFTLALQDRFLQQSPLDLVNQNGDIKIDGEITDYRENPVAITTGDQSAASRLTITVKVRYENKYDEDKNFERTFTDYLEFPATQTLQSVQDQLVPEIIDRLVDQIYNAILADW